MVNHTIVVIYENYLEDMRNEASKEARRFDSVSRIITGKRSKTEELLPAFDERLETELNRLFGHQSNSADVRELAELMLDQVSDNRDEPQLKYSFMAVQRHLIPLVSCLSSGDASILVKKFETAIPSRERFPVHKELIKKLREQSKQ